MSQVNAMMEGLLLMFAFQETFAHQEICRRFCLPNTSNKEAKKFQEACRQHGIPPRFVNSSLWKVVTAVPIGSGNPAMAISQANQLMQWRPMYAPEAQQEILHEATAIVVNDPRKAARWAPIGQQPTATTASKQAEADFNLCMQGAMPEQREGLSLVEQVDRLLSLMEGVINGIVQTTGMASQQQVIGFTVLNAYITMLVQQLAQDEQQKQNVKMFMDRLGKAMNEVKGFAQRLQEQQQTQNGDNGETKAKIESMVISAHAKARIGEEKAAQSRRHKEVQFLSDQSRKDQETQAQIHRENAIAATKMRNESATTLADVHNDAMREATEPEPVDQ
jgi:hypothetical protein